MNKILIAYLIAINFVAIIITISDKRKAIKGKWRISENMLMLISAIGGSVSMYLTMKLIHHKTLHKKFMVGIPLIILLQIIAVILILYFF